MTNESSSSAPQHPQEDTPLLTTDTERHTESDNQGESSNEESHFILEAVLDTALEAVHVVEDVAVQTVETLTAAVEQVVEQASEVVETVSENVVEEIQHVKDMALEELHEADEGVLTILDMTMTRGCSILPGELQEAADMMTQHVQQQEEEKQLMEADNENDIAIQKPAAIPLSAYLGLLSAVVSLSAIGPLLQVQQNTSGCMKILWRLLGTSTLLTPLAIIDLIRDGFPRLTGPQWVTFLLSSLCYAGMTVGFVLSLPLTAIGNAVILSNSQAIILLVGNLFVGAPVTLVEAGGATLAFIGALLCSKDSGESSESDGNDDTNKWTALAGDALALSSGACGVGYLVFARSVRPHMGLFTFTWGTMTMGCIFCFLLQVVVLEETVTFDRDVSTGVWGFLNPEFDRLPVELVIVVICNLLGTMGYIRAMQFFDSLIISVAGLCEPVTAELLAFAFGVSVLPGPVGWLGNFCVAAGTLGVVYPTDGKGPTATH